MGDGLKERIAERDALPNPPVVAESIDWSPVIACAETGIAQAIEQGWLDEDLKHYIYESVLKAVYGPDIFKWLRTALL